MKRLGFENNLKTYSKLINLYAQKNRHYHNFSHIDATLYHLERSQYLANDVDAIELALWFHDAIYNVYSSKNELKSANWAADFLSKNQAEDDFIQKVHRLIMVTCHDSQPSDNDERLIVDIDLSILGCSSVLYEKFEIWVSKEYSLIPSFIYKKKRKKVLESFLARDKIYSHNYFYDM